MISGDGTEVRGREAIGNVLQMLISNGTKVELELHSLRQAGATALATGRLTMRTQAPNGEPLNHSSDSLVVYRQGEDGFWRVAIDFPWGLPVSNAQGPISS
jgi:ketosteroid isomerase-like protein